MSEREAFIAAIAANPDDDLPRLVYADWLDENGDRDRAEFIRLQIATYRESQQFPPNLDEAKYNRIQELFEANGENWLRAVYDPLNVPLPQVKRQQVIADSNPPTLLGRLARGVTRLFAGARPINPFVDRAHFYNRMVFVSHGGVAPPIANLSVSRGFVDTLTLNPAQWVSGGAFVPAMLAEPITDLTLNLNGEDQHWRQWQRVNDPCLRRLHTLSLTLGAEGDSQGASASVYALCASESLSGLCELRLTSGISHIENVMRVANSNGVIDALQFASFRGNLRKLHLDRIAGAVRFLADPGIGFDLRELSFTAADSPEPELVTNLQRMPFRDRLVKLSLGHTSFDPLPLTSGPPWPSLETLWLTSNELGDNGAAAFANSTAFPAVRTLWLRGNGVRVSGVQSLARSPWISQLRQLNLDNNPIGDEGAEIAAELFGCGLEQLSLTNTETSGTTRKRLKQQYGSRITFSPPSIEVSELMQ